MRFLLCFIMCIIMCVAGAAMLSGLLRHYTKKYEIKWKNNEYPLVVVMFLVVSTFFLGKGVIFRESCFIDYLFLSYLFLLVLVLIGWIDYKRRIIPDGLNLLILLLGLSGQILPGIIGDTGIIGITGNTGIVGIRERLLGMLILSLPMFFFDFVYPGGFGGGDVKFLAATGFYMGWQRVLAGALTGSLPAAAVCVYLLLTRKSKRKDTIAFGPFLCLGMAVAEFDKWLWIC